jgi:hypothetical protein
MIGVPLTNSGVSVSSGFFTTRLDYGGIFDGTDVWLQIAVRTNHAPDFSTLTPRQQLTPVPAALYATTAGTAGKALLASDGNPIASSIQVETIATTVAQFVVATNFQSSGTVLNPGGLTPMFVSSLMQPGGIVVMGDSLCTMQTSNRFGGTTPGWITCGGYANPYAIYTNGINFFTNQVGQNYTNSSWLMELTNYISEQTGWNVPLDTALCVPGLPSQNYGLCADGDTFFFSGCQTWNYPPGVYSANGTNTVYFQSGLTNRVVFFSTNDFGTTNDFFLTYGGVNYSNVISGTNCIMKFFVPGNIGGTVPVQIVGRPNALISVRDFVPYRPNNCIGPAQHYLPPLYTDSTANTPLTYLTNVSPLMTGVPKAFILNPSQNDRFIVDYKPGTNAYAITPNNTNNVDIYFSTVICGYGHIAKNLGFWPVVVTTIPASPTFWTGTSNALCLSDRLNALITNGPVNPAFDVVYDLAASNAYFSRNFNYFTDGTHPLASTARLEATNMALRFAVQKSLKIKY